MKKPPDPIDSAKCETLARRSTGGDGDAWRELVGHLWPASLRIVATRPQMRAFGASPDQVEDVVTKVLGKLGDGGARGLKLYALWREENPGKTFEDWIRIVLANAVRDYVRDHADESPAAARKELSVTRLLNEFTRSSAIEEIGERPALTEAQTVKKLLVYAAQHLPEDQYQALMLWLDRHKPDEIAKELGLEGPEAAQKLVRAAIAVLRRQFAGQV